MPTSQYRVQHSYHSVGAERGPWKAGDVVELAPADAEWVNRDSPGCLLAAGGTVEAAPVVGEEREKPPSRNRQHRGGVNRSST